MTKSYDVLLWHSFAHLARAVRAEGHVPFALPGVEWTDDEMPLFTRGTEKQATDAISLFDRRVRRWLTGAENRILVDAYGNSDAAVGFCMNRGLPYLGPGTKAAKLERNRRFSRKLFQAVGIAAGRNIAVRNARMKATLLSRLRTEYETTGRLYVVKADTEDYTDFDKVLVPTSWEDFEWAYEHHTPPISLEEKVTGIEVAFTVMVVDGRIIPLHTNFEHKNSHNGNLGVPAAEMGTLIVRGIAPRVMQELWEPLQPYFAENPCRCHVDINCIFDPQADSLMPLEFTVRFGEPTGAIVMHMLEQPMAQHLAWAHGDIAAPVWRANTAVGIVVTPSGFPAPRAPLSRDTEILTENGWHRIDSVKIGEKILTRRDSDSVLEWQPIQALPQTYAETLLHFKSRGIDLLVTDEHTMLCQPQDRYGTREAQYSHVKRISAEELWGKTGWFLPCFGAWHGETPEKLFERDAGDVCEFIGWMISEGCVSERKRPDGLNYPMPVVQLTQSRKANRRKFRRIEKLLHRLGFQYHFGKKQDRMLIAPTTMPGTLLQLLKSCGKGAANKCIPHELFRLSKALLKRLYVGLMLGDGSGGVNQRRDVLQTYYTTSKQLADDFQTLLVLLGKKGHVKCTAHAGTRGGKIRGRQIVAKHDKFIVTICKSRRVKYDRAFHARVPYQDIAFCVTVQNHAIYVRRNGIPCWTGNCIQHVPLVEGPMKTSTFEPIWRLLHPEWGHQVFSGRQGVVVCPADTVAAARTGAYADVKQIQFETVYYRTDIASKWSVWRDVLGEHEILTDEQTRF